MHRPIAVVRPSCSNGSVLRLPARSQFAWLQMDDPTDPRSQHSTPVPPAFAHQSFPKHPSPAPAHAFAEAAAFSSALGEAYDASYDADAQGDGAGGMPPLRPFAHHHQHVPAAYQHPPPRYDPNMGNLPFDTSARGMYEAGGFEGAYQMQEMGGERQLSTEQLAGQFANALGVSFDAIQRGAHAASRAPTVRAPAGSRRHRPPAANFMQPPPSQLYGGAAPPHATPPHHVSTLGVAHDISTLGVPHAAAASLMYEAPPIPPHLDAEALTRIPTAAIQPLAPLGMPMPHAHQHPAAMTQGMADAGATPQPPQPQPVGAPALSNSTGRNGAERKEWSVSEDNIIRESVQEHGCRWRRIAAQLPGRSDDAVRNRWNRLKEMGIGESATPAASAATDALALAPASGAAADEPAMSIPLPEGVVPIAGTTSAQSPARPPNLSGVAKTEKERPERVSWSKMEDDTILLGVSELGHKWNRIAERLPGRTDHAIRNRFHRLQSLLQDRQRQQQRILAPNMPPLPVPMTMPMGVPTSGAMVTTVGGVQSLLACADGFTPGSCESSGYETPVGTSTSPGAPSPAVGKA